MKLYTQTVCPKCMLLKNTLSMAGVLDKVEIINLDEHEDVREWLKSEESGNPYLGLPVFEHEGSFYADSAQIMTVVTSAE